MFVLVPLLAPLVLLAVMGMAWVEDHLLPPADPPLKPKPNRSRRVTSCKSSSPALIIRCGLCARHADHHGNGQAGQQRGRRSHTERSPLAPVSSLRRRDSFATLNSLTSVTPQE